MIAGTWRCESMKISVNVGGRCVQLCHTRVPRIRATTQLERITPLFRIAVQKFAYLTAPLPPVMCNYIRRGMRLITVYVRVKRITQEFD